MMTYSQGAYLTVLTHAPPAAVKELAEAIIPQLGAIEVLQNRSGLVMLPYQDTAQGATFHLGEILVAEAHVRIMGKVEGYALCMGRDLQQALAIALLDAAMQAGIESERIAEFIHEQARAQAEADEELLKQVEATRVEMETF